MQHKLDFVKRGKRKKWKKTEKKVRFSSFLQKICMKTEENLKKRILPKLIFPAVMEFGYPFRPPLLPENKSRKKRKEKRKKCASAEVCIRSFFRPFSSGNPLRGIRMTVLL